MMSAKQLSIVGIVMLLFGIIHFFASHSVNSVGITGDFVVAGAVLLAAAKISHSIDESRKSSEDRRPA